jgi:type II secretory pathway pseudopilin PulG
LNDGDEIAIATFGCIKDGRSALNYIYDFGNSTSGMLGAVQNHKTPKDLYHNKDYSDLHYAIDEAIKDLSNYETELPKAIYVFSAEYNNKQNSSSSAQDNIASANKSNIQIHTIKYNFKGYGKHQINHIAEGTNGSHHTTDRKKANGENSSELLKRNLNSAESFIKKSYDEISLRSYGLDYTLSFKSPHEKDGKVHALEVKSKDGEKASIGYQSPKANWFKENLLWVCIVGFLLIGLLIYLLIYNKKQKEKRAQQQAQDLNQLKEEQMVKDNKAQEKFKHQEMQMQLIKDKEQAEKNKQLDEQRKKEREAHLQKMKDEMNRSGNLPVLHFSIGDQHGSITIENPTFKIGRDESNDLFINHPTVSRNHLIISFDEKGYNLVDSGSANGTLLNGNKVKQSDLRDGDILQVGEVKIVYSK